MEGRMKEAGRRVWKTPTQERDTKPKERSKYHHLDRPKQKTHFSLESHFSARTSEGAQEQFTSKKISPEDPPDASAASQL